MSNGDWYVDILSPEAREVLEMFGYEGNTEDYWLGTPYDRTSNVGWRSADDVVADMRRREIADWSYKKFKVGDSWESREGIERMVQDEPNARDRAGGLVGVDPSLYYRVKAKLVALGSLAGD